MPPTIGQIVLLCVAIACYVAGGLATMHRQRFKDYPLQVISRTLLSLGSLVTLGVILWHSLAQGKWLPVADNFDALLTLALMLSVFVLYVQARRPLGGLEWFVMPLVIVLLVAAAIFGEIRWRAYVASTWNVAHVVAVFAGVVAFAVAGCTGALYLIAHRRLRNKKKMPGPNLGSIERLEHLTLGAVSVGFALLTIGMLTGIMIALHPAPGSSSPRYWYVSPKILLSMGAWAVYAVALHSPINPSFRGRKTAMLSIAGLVLMIGVLVAVQFMPAQFSPGAVVGKVL